MERQLSQEFLFWKTIDRGGKEHHTNTKLTIQLNMGLPCGSAGKESTCNVGDLGLIPELWRSPGEKKGYPLQYSGLENSMDCIVHRVTKSWTWLSDFHFHHCPHTFVFYICDRESIPRQTDKKSRVPKEKNGVWGCWSGDRGLEFSRRRKGQTFFVYIP